MKYIKLTLLALTLGFMATLFVSQWQQIQTIAWQLNVPLLALSLAGGVMILFLNAWGWHLILRGLGQTLPATTSVYIWLLASVVRYIPGGIWAITSRAALANKEGVPLSALTASLYLEALLSASTALLVGIPALYSGNALSFSPVVMAGLMLSNLLMLNPKIIKRLAQLLPGDAGRTLMTMKWPSAGVTAALYFYYLAFWILLGLVFLLFVQSISPLSIGFNLVIGSSMALSFFMGFVVLFAPGGLGVRESILCLLLLPVTGAPIAIVVSVGSRLWLMVSEAISVMLVLVLFREQAKSVNLSK
jgi:glycosyltransferase 2 family protein